MADAVYVDSGTDAVFYLGFNLVLIQAPIRSDDSFDAREGRAAEPRDEFERAHFAEVRASLLDELGVHSEAADERGAADETRRNGDWPEELYREATPPVSGANVRRIEIVRDGPTQLPAGAVP